MKNLLRRTGTNGGYTGLRNRIVKVKKERNQSQMKDQGFTGEVLKIIMTH